jgi:hypothetical protein
MLVVGFMWCMAMAGFLESSAQGVTWRSRPNGSLKSMVRVLCIS